MATALGIGQHMYGFFVCVARRQWTSMGVCLCMVMKLCNIAIGSVAVPVVIPRNEFLKWIPQSIMWVVEQLA